MEVVFLYDCGGLFIGLGAGGCFGRLLLRISSGSFIRERLVLILDDFSCRSIGTLGILVMNCLLVRALTSNSATYIYHHYATLAYFDFAINFLD